MASLRAGGQVSQRLPPARTTHKAPFILAMILAGAVRVSVHEESQGQMLVERFPPLKLVPGYLIYPQSPWHHKSNLNPGDGQKK